MSDLTVVDGVDLEDLEHAPVGARGPADDGAMFLSLGNGEWTLEGASGARYTAAELRGYGCTRITELSVPVDWLDQLIRDATANQLAAMSARTAERGLRRARLIADQAAEFDTEAPL